MNLDPAVQRFVNVDAGDNLSHLTVPDQRQFMRHLVDLNFLRFSSRGPEVHSITDFGISVDGGRITARVYHPGPEDGLPAHLSLHGGGWWHGSIDDYISDAIWRQRCVQARTVVIGLDYRLAPEHRFPAALDDTYATLCWMADNARALRIDPGSISVGGSSAGGNLAAALTLKTRDEHGPRLSFQLLEVPALDLTQATARRAVTQDGTGQDMVDEISSAIEHYLSGPGQALDPLVSPLLAGDLSGLPDAVVFTAELDPLHAEGEQYAERLAAAGVSARVVRHPGALHGTAMLTRTWPPAAAWQREAAAVLRQAHWPENPTESGR
jgi:acetyl esterase